MARRALILIEGEILDPCSPICPIGQASWASTNYSFGLSRSVRYLVAEGIEAIRVATNGFESLMDECSRLRATYDIAGITSSEEQVYATVGKLCRYFDLPGPNPTSIQRCCDKFTQRQLLAEAGVPMPAYRLAKSATEVEIAAADFGLPVILKPAVGSGSMGVRLCRHLDEVSEHTNYLFGGTHIWRSSPRILVEEFVQGPYYWVDMMADEVIGIGAANFGCPPHFVHRECTYPAVLTVDQQERIADVSRSCLQALGLVWGPTTIGFRWTKRGPVVIEVNPRLSGTPGPQMIKLAYGVHLVTEHIKLVIGDEWDLRRTCSHAAGARFLLPDRDGILNWIDGDSRGAAVPGVVEVKLHVQPQTPIVRKGDYRDCLGYVIASSPTRAGTEAILQHAVDVDWSITPSCPWPTVALSAASLTCGDGEA